MAWTKSGTVNLTNGSAVVYGAGTAWVSGGMARPGDVFIAPGGGLYEVASVQSNTQITLSSAYLGSTAGAQAYSIVHTGLLPSELAINLSSLQSKYLTTISQLWEWETSNAATVPLTNPATGVTTNVKPIAGLVLDVGGKAPIASPSFTGPVTVHKGTVTGPNDVLTIAPERGALGRESRIIFGSTFSTGWVGADYGVRYSGAIGYGSTGGPDPRDIALKFYTSDLFDVPTERMRIDNNGRVGIGAAAASARLESYSTASLNTRLVKTAVVGGDGPLLAFSNYNNDSGLADVAAIQAHLQSGTPGIESADLIFLTKPTSSGNVERLRITSGGNVLVTSPAGLGYGPGAGGTVTQATSKSTAVTLNKPSGQITMHNGSLGAGASAMFNCTTDRA